MGAAIASAILMVLLSGAGIAYPEIISMVGTKRTSRLTAIAKTIYNMIADNRELLDKLADAYQRKDADYATQLMQGAGFGPRTAAVRDAIQKAKTAYLEAKSQYQKRDADLTNKYNEVNQASYNTNTISGIIKADEIANNVEQAINGGANETKKE